MCRLEFAMASIAALRLLCCSLQISVNQDVDAVAQAFDRVDYATTCVKIIKAMLDEIGRDCAGDVVHAYWRRAVWPSYPMKYNFHLGVRLSAPLLPEHIACPLADMSQRCAAVHESSAFEYEFFRLVAFRRTLKLLEYEVVAISCKADSDAVDAECDLMEFVSVLR